MKLDVWITVDRVSPTHLRINSGKDCQSVVSPPCHGSCYKTPMTNSRAPTLEQEQPEEILIAAEAVMTQVPAAATPVE